MNLHRHEFVQFLRERPDHTFRTCDPCNCPAAAWLTGSVGSVLTVTGRAIRYWGPVVRGRGGIADVEKTPLWLADFIRTVDEWGAGRINGNGIRSEITGRDALRLLESCAVPI